MTQLSIPEIAQVWLGNGGSRAAVVSATAVALAESGGFTDAVSPASDYGLWQINIINLRSRGISTSQAFDPNVSAEIAIDMSGNGTNWAAWCTCWTDPVDNCGHGFLSIPQRISPAGDHLAGVAAVLGEYPPMPDGPAPAASNAAAFQVAWGHVAEFHGHYAQTSWNAIHNIRRQIGSTRP